MNNILPFKPVASPGKKSFLALDHVFLIAMNLFDAAHGNHSMDFFLSTSLLTTSLELEDSEWEQILARIDKTLGDLNKMSIKGVALSCRNDGVVLKLSFYDPGYHDLELAQVVIQEKVSAPAKKAA